MNRLATWIPLSIWAIQSERFISKCYARQWWVFVKISRKDWVSLFQNDRFGRSFLTFERIKRQRVWSNRGIIHRAMASIKAGYRLFTAAYHACYRSVLIQLVLLRFLELCSLVNKNNHKQYSFWCPECWKLHFRASKFQIFLGEHIPRPR